MAFRLHGRGKAQLSSSQHESTRESAGNRTGTHAASGVPRSQQTSVRIGQRDPKNCSWYCTSRQCCCVDGSWSPSIPIPNSSSSPISAARASHAATNASFSRLVDSLVRDGWSEQEPAEIQMLIAGTIWFANLDLPTSKDDLWLGPDLLARRVDRRVDARREGETVVIPAENGERPRGRAIEPGAFTGEMWAGKVADGGSSTGHRLGYPVDQIAVAGDVADPDAWPLGQMIGETDELSAA
jgi:hypothetical protein